MRTKTTLVAPEEFEDWVSGEQTLAVTDGLLPGASLYGYRYGAGEEALVPALRDFLIVAHRQPRARLHRMIDGRWRSDDLVRGDVSFFARAEESHWRWDDDLDVLHLHLTQDQLLETSRQMFQRDIVDVDLHNSMRTRDPAIHRVTCLLAEESAAGRAGNELIVESLLTQLGVLVLRRHADIAVREERTGGLTLAQQRVVRDYVAAHLGEHIGLDDLAGAVYLSRYHFLRLFRDAMQVTPHDYVTRRRVELAARLLTRTSRPIREIATDCGFADQSHLTRVFRRRTGMTPGQFRASGG